MPTETGFRRKRWSMGLSCGHSRIIATRPTATDGSTSFSSVTRWL
jgi:hypothetical protein